MGGPVRAADECLSVRAKEGDVIEDVIRRATATV